MASLAVFAHPIMYISGRPSSPTLTVVAATLQTAIFTISPPSYAVQCVLNYTINATRSDGIVVPDITVEVNDTEAQYVIATRSGLDFCYSIHTFTVVANTLAVPGEAGHFGPYAPTISKLTVADPEILVRVE